MTSDKNWGPSARNLGIQCSAGPLSDHSFKETNVDAYKTNNVSQFLSNSGINFEDDIYHTDRAQILGAYLPDGPPESGNNESQLLESGPDFLHPPPKLDANVKQCSTQDETKSTVMPSLVFAPTLGYIGCPDVRVGHRLPRYLVTVVCEMFLTDDGK